MKSTKRSLLLSIFSILLCVVMLLGTTFAWFTDTVTSGANKIVAGNLDIELEYSKDGTAWNPVEGASELFSDVTLWEPGATSVVYLKLTNKGTLALKYNLAITATGGDFTNVAGEAKNLKDALKFAQVAGSSLTTFATREEAVAAAASATLGLEDYSQANRMAANDVSYITLVVTMPTTVDNEFNYKPGTAAPEIALSILLKATQLSAENDGFDNTYDAGAPWLGGIDAVPEEEDGVITILTAEQLAGFAQAVNAGTSFAGKTVKLGSNIDLNNLEWPGISVNNQFSAFTFDGNGKTVYNLKVTKTGNSAGFFNTAPSCTVKNLTVDGASVSGANYAAAIVGHGLCAKIENCTVKNAAIVANPVLMNSGKYDEGAKAGAIVGYLSGEPAAYVKSCTVSDTTIAAFRDLGAIAGMANGTAEVSGNTVGENVKLAYLFAAPYDGHVNENMNDYAGRVATGATVENNTGVAEKGEANLLTTPADLVMFAAAVNNGFDFAGQTVKLGNDVDFNGASILPIGTEGAGAFAGTFDGNGKTVKNANISGVSGVGFIGYIGSGTLKNLTLENVNTKGVEHVGVLVGYTATGASTVTGCTVKNSSATGVMRDAADDSANAVGGIIGHVAAGGGTIYLTNNTIDGLTVTGYRKLGALVGCAQSGAQTSVDIEGNTATNVTIIHDLSLNGNPRGLAAGATVDAYVGDGVPAGEYRTAIEGSNSATVTIHKITPVAVPENATPAETQTAVNETVAAASAGDVVVLPNTEAGVKLPTVAAGVTLKGDGTTKIDATAALPNINGATLEGFVMDCGQSNYHGFTHSDAVIKNCTIKGLLFSYNAGGEQVFENCTFINDKESGEYNMWAYGSTTYKNCVFKSYGKFINVYNEGTAHFDVNFDGCTFINLKATANKAAVNVKDTSGSNQLNITVTVNDCSYEGVAPATQDTATLKVFNPVVQLDDIGAGPSKITIVQDGTTLWSH